jgi:hypothetical protein
MATLSFEGESHGEIVQKVKRWLNSLAGEEELLTTAEAIERTAELTKDALRVIASSAPGPIAQSDVVKGLTGMGYNLTDATSKAMVDALDSLGTVTGGNLVERVKETPQNVFFQMNQAVAKQILRSLRPPSRSKKA